MRFGPGAEEPMPAWFPRPSCPEEFYWQLFQLPWCERLHEEAAIKLMYCPASELYCQPTAEQAKQLWRARWDAEEFLWLDAEKAKLAAWMELPGPWASCTDSYPEEFGGYPAELGKMNARFSELQLTGPPYEECTALAERNPLPSDNWVLFQDEGHLYFFADELELSDEEKAKLRKIVSVTTLLHHSWHPFKELKMSERIANKRNHPPGDRYYMKDAEQIRALWELERRLGTEAHVQAERMAHLKPYQCNAKSMFLYRWFMRDHPELEWYRTEKYVADKARRICGSADLIFRNWQTGKFYLGDIKTCFELRRSGFCRCSRACEVDEATGEQRMFCLPGARFKCKRYGVFPSNSRTEDCNVEHYRQQLTIYRYYFEENDKLEFYGQCMIGINPRQQDYICIEVEPNVPLLLDTFAWRERQLLEPDTH